MPSIPELQQTNSYLAEIEGFRTMARLHGVPTGTPECVASLPLRLAQDWRLRGNFVELLRELQRKDPEFSLPDALAILLLAVGGPKASPNRSRHLEESVDLTAGFLASLGGWPGSDEQPITDLDNPSDFDPRLDPLYAADAQQPSSPVSPEHATEQAPETPAAAEEPEAVSEEDAEPAKPETPAGISLAEITQALARLERGTVDLRLHLDSIDQRLSRMEPLLESPALTQPEPPAGSAQNSAQTDLPARTRPAEVLIEPSRPATSSVTTGTPPLPPFATPERHLVHRDDLPPAISPTPQPSASPADDAPGAPQALLDTEVTPHVRALTPRRDRFAAAMEIPGTRSALNFPAREEEPLPADSSLPPSAPLQVAAAALPPTSLRPSPPEPPATTATGSPVTPQTKPIAATANPAASSATPETAPDSSASPKLSPIFTPSASAQPAFPAQPANPDLPVATTVPTPASPPDKTPARASATFDSLSAAPPTTAPAAPPSTPVPPDILSALSAMGSGELPPLRSVPSFTFGGSVMEVAPSAATETEDESEIEHTSRGPLLLGLVAALLITLAAVLLLRGKPLPFLVGQPKSAASQSAPEAAPAPSAVPTPPSRLDAQPRGSAPLSPHTISKSVPHSIAPSTTPSSTDRVLSARQVDEPASAEQILATPTFVPEAVMKTRLLSAPAPLYPKFANAVGVEGGIIFEAIIARDGSVEGLTPLGGQRLLRDAAANAVRQWRYQPFLLRGQPVEVRSIIHVNVAPPAADTPSQ